MEHQRIFSAILDFGAELIKCGAETHRTEDSMYRLLAAYGFTEANVWVIPSNIQSTVLSPNGERFTQVRHVRGAGVDFDRLDRLNALSRSCCAATPDGAELEGMLKKAIEPRSHRTLLAYIAAVTAGVSFGVFFNCDFADAVAAAAASLLIAAFGRSLRTRESNPLILNFVIAAAAELLILVMVRLGIGHHSGSITVGVVMLLISALGTTNGVRDLAHLDTLSGVMNISASITGGAGIAMGIALPLLLLPSWGTGENLGSVSTAVGFISAMAGTVGFALYFNVVKVRHLLSCALCTAATWGAYLFFNGLLGTIFLPTLIACAVCAMISLLLARVNRAPATIFQTVSIFPLIPGSSLYYMLYGFVTGSNTLGRESATKLFITCLAIVLGFMVVEAVNRFIRKAP